MVTTEDALQVDLADRLAVAPPQQLVEDAAFSALSKLAMGDAAIDVRTLQHTDRVRFHAAFPGYPENFSRDSLLAMSVAGIEAGLRSQIDYSVARMGTRTNAFTGEEDGKVHHQDPGVELRGRNTMYNACDTSAWLLSSIAALAERGDDDIIQKHRQAIDRAIGYIQRHTNDALLFFEDPRLSGSDEFSLIVTYWKDSILNHPTYQKPVYPIVYTLAHFQNADALQRIAVQIGDVHIFEQAKLMKQAGVKQLWRGDHFVTAVHGEGDIDAPSSDSLHALLYLRPDELSDGYAQRIEAYSKQLETPVGYLPGIAAAPGRDDYHTAKVWTQEQAMLHAAAQKHGLSQAVAITERIGGYFDPARGVFPELVDPKSLEPAGNLLQLWAVCAALYFANPKRAIL